MTTFDRFDPFERRISEAIDEIAAARRLNYLDDILRQTARSSQRPRWTFPERWFNVDTTIPRPALFGRLPVRQLIVIAVVVALAAAALAFYIGSQTKLPPPLGPARNGQIVYGFGGDIYVRDSMTATPRLLIGGPSEQGGVAASPDGQLIAYDNVVSGLDHAWVAGIDGSRPRQVLEQPFTGMTFQWSYDSRSAVAVTDSAGHLQLWNAPADGSGALEIKLDGLWPWEATWDPQRQGALLIRAEDRLLGLVDLYYTDVNGTILSKIDLTGQNIDGARYEFSGVAFSPDGATIAYNSIEAREAPVNRFRVHLMARDGTHDRTIAAPLESLYSQAWPIFSPDGIWVLMDSWETKLDGAVAHQLAIAPTDGSAVARRIGPIIDSENLIKLWSPDGTRILYCACDRNEVYSIDPISGSSELLPWRGDLPGWQRLALP